MSIPLTMRTVDGYGLGVRRVGAGTPVLLIHGIPTNSLLWRDVQPPLSSHADVIAVDLLGYGASDKPVEVAPTLPRQAELLCSLLAALKLDSVIVVGHDIGGGVAQLMAAMAPERLQSLVLVNSVAYDSWPEPGIARLKDPEWDERLQGVDLVRGFRNGLERGLHRTDRATDEVAVMYAAPFTSPEGRCAYLRAARALDAEHLLARTDDIEAIDLPVEVVWGALDPFQPLEFGQRLAKALSRGRLTVWDDASHFVPEDVPDRLATLLAGSVVGNR